MEGGDDGHRGGERAGDERGGCMAEVGDGGGGGGGGHRRSTRSLMMEEGQSRSTAEKI